MLCWMMLDVETDRGDDVVQLNSTGASVEVPELKSSVEMSRT